VSCRCVFFDRDGIVNKHPNNRIIRSWEEFRFMPGFMESLRVVKEKGFCAVIITNQQGIRKGEYTAETVEMIHSRLVEKLGGWGLNLLDIFYCPHTAADDCACRKPKPGMIFEAAEKHNIDLSRSWVIGDQERDVQAGYAAGCRCVRVHASPKTMAEHRIESMDQLSALLDKIL